MYEARAEMINDSIEEPELEFQLRHALREWLVYSAALQYGHPDDPRRIAWSEQANHYRQQLHKVLAAHWELDPELDQLKKTEWPNAREIAARLIDSRS